MLNYTINRKIETLYDYACNCFSTNQIAGQVAGSNTALDGDIVWYIDADPGYTVDILDFSVADEIAPGSFAGRVFAGSNLPSPILGVTIEQVSNFRLRVTIYLMPNTALGITGTTFSMPNNRVTAILDISGCAKENAAMTVINMDHSSSASTAAVNILPTFTSILTAFNYSNHISVSGMLLSSHANNALFTYTLTPPAGSYFLSIPTISLDTTIYYYTTQPVYTGINITSAVFTIYKS
jgi:hypothetical protein